MTMDPGAAGRHRARAAAGGVRGLDHHRSHLARRRDEADSPAGRYLLERQVSRGEFNSYGSRRGNHEVMMRGTFANIRIRNKMLENVEGSFTRYAPNGRDQGDL